MGEAEEGGVSQALLRPQGRAEEVQDQGGGAKGDGRKRSGGGRR